MSNKRSDQTRKKARKKSKPNARAKRKKNIDGSGLAKANQQLAKAIELHKINHLTEAESLYRNILREYPNHIDAQHFLGVLLSNSGQTDEGEILIREVIANSPDYFDAHNNLGNILQILGRHEEAKRCYENSLQLRPNAAEPLINLGVISAILKDDETAEKFFRDAIRVSPTNALAFHRLAKLMLKRKEVDLALEYFDEALKHAEGPLLKTVLIAKSNSLLILNRKAESIKLYKQWLTKFPDDETAKHMLAAISGDETPEKPGEEYVKQLFDRFSTFFDSVLEGLEYKAPELISSQVKDRYSDNKRDLQVLDAGCGTGLCGEFLRPIAAHLTGVDLSPGMLHQAKVLSHYDDLVQAELVSFLSDKSNDYDLIVSADTLCYLGNLDDFFKVAAQSMKPGARLIFTVESEESDCDRGYILQPHGRYSHTKPYITKSLNNSGLSVADATICQLRMERGVPVEGMLITATNS